MARTHQATEVRHMENFLIAILGGGNLLLFVKFLIERWDRKKDTTEDTNARLDKLEKDGLRTQLLLMILFRPQEQTEILKVAEYYFGTLKGNWYMTSIFNKWLEENEVAKPEWFNKGE